MSTNSNPLMPSNIPVSSNQPVRAVINPTSQENRNAQEILNNQVPLQTRANNFWDNFQSYSRQNLPSTSNTSKRNDNIGLPVAPQVWQVHPMVSNGNINNGTEVANSYFSIVFNSLLDIFILLAVLYIIFFLDGSTINPDRHSRIPDLVNSSKKPNINVPSNAQCRYAAINKKESAVNMNSSSVRNLSSDQYPSIESSHQNSSSVNLIQLRPNQDLSKVGFC